MSKPTKKPFVIENDGYYATFKSDRFEGEITWDEFDGTRFATLEEAQEMIDEYAMDGSEIVILLNME